MAVKIFFSSEAENPFYLVTVAVAIVLKMSDRHDRQHRVGVLTALVKCSEIFILIMLHLFLIGGGSSSVHRDLVGLSPVTEVRWQFTSRLGMHQADTDICISPTL